MRRGEYHRSDCADFATVFETHHSADNLEGQLLRRQINVETRFTDKKLPTHSGLCGIAIADPVDIKNEMGSVGSKSLHANRPAFHAPVNKLLHYQLL